MFLFAVVYALGHMGLPTLVPYLTAVLVAATDGARTWRRTRRSGISHHH